MTWQSEDLAYLAGIIDGEGSIMIVIQKDPYPLSFTLQVTASTTSEILADWLKLWDFGMSSYRAKPHHKLVYRFWLCGVKAKELLKQIYPYLKIKRDLASIALEFPVHLKSEGRHSYSEEDKLQQAISYVQARDLNAKGSKNGVRSDWRM